MELQKGAFETCASSRSEILEPRDSNDRLQACLIIRLALGDGKFNACVSYGGQIFKPNVICERFLGVLMAYRPEIFVKFHPESYPGALAATFADTSE